MSILKISRFAHLTLAICLLTMALLLTAVRYWLLPQASQWRDELTTSISAIIGESIQIKSLSASMRGFRPEVTMRGFRIENANHDGPSLDFERLNVGLDIVNTLVTRKPVVNFIDLAGAKVRLSQNPDGGISVGGLKSGDTPLWLFAEGEVRFSDIDMEWDLANGGQPMPLGRAQIRLRNTGERHQLDAKVDLPGKLGKLVKVSVDINGNPLKSNEWVGNAYLEAKRLREGAFIESFPVRLHSGEAGLQAWAKWKGGAINEVISKLDLDRPVFVWRGSDGADGLLNLDKLKGWLIWHKLDSGWSLTAKHFNLSQRGRAWPETDFAVAVGKGPDDALQSFRAAVNYLRFDDAEALINAGLPLLDKNVGETLRSFAPKGEIRDARLVYQTDGHFGFCGQLSDIAYTPPDGWPKIGKVNGRLCGNDLTGSLEFNAVKPEINLSSLWQKPIQPEVFSGNFQWIRSGHDALPLFQNPFDATKMFADSAWRIVGNHIELVAPGLQLGLGFALDLPAGEGLSPAIDLKAHLHEVEAARLRDYLPMSAFNPSTAKWLGGAFVNGKLKTADVVLRGQLANFPFRQGEGQFSAQVDTENLELDFNPDWPHLFDIKAKLQFSGSSLIVDSVGGRIGNIPFHAAHAETPDYLGNDWLSLNGNLDGEFATTMKFLRQTPGRFIPDRLSRVAEPAGPYHLDLNLQIPLAPGMGDVGVGGLLQLKSGSLALKGSNLKVQGVTGELSFTGKGIEGKQLFANIMDEPVLFDVAHKQDNIHIDMLGKAGVPALRKAFPGEFWKHAEGDFSYHANLQIPESLDTANKPMRFNLNTDLAGLELKLPAPMVKSADEKKAFNADLAMRRGDHLSLHLAYGNEGRARLLFSDADALRLESGDVVWEKSQPPASGERGLGLFLKLNKLDMGEWRRLFAGMGVGLVKSVPHELDIQIGKLLWNGEDLGPLNLKGKPESGELLGELDCFLGKGSFIASYLESNQVLLRMNLEYLNLPKFADEREGQPRVTAIDPAALPVLQLHTRHLMRQGMDFGGLELDTEHLTTGLNIKHLRLVAENHDIGLRGSWMRQNGHDETKLEGRLKINDLDQFLNLLGYGEEIFRTPTEAVISLVWEGAPQQFSAASVVGDIRFKMGRGRVLPVEPGASRALTMLNLQTLRKVLSVDFSNLFGNGLAYDSMEGAFQLWGGQARTKGFLIDAVAGEILIMGRVGLVDHDVEQNISVIPQSQSSSSRSSSFFGGAVIDMSHRLMNAEDVNLASTNYSVTGSLDDPQIKRIEGGLTLELINRAWSDFKSMADMDKRGADVIE